MLNLVLILYIKTTFNYEVKSMAKDEGRDPMVRGSDPSGKGKSPLLLPIRPQVILRLHQRNPFQEGAAVGDGTRRGGSRRRPSALPQYHQVLRLLRGQAV